MARIVDLLVVVVTVGLLVPSTTLGAEIKSEEWWRRELQQASNEEKAFADASKSVPEIPEADNYKLVAGTQWWACVWFVCGGNKRSNLAQRLLRTNDGAPAIFGSQTEMKLYSTPEDTRELYNSAVVQASLYDRPLDDDTPPKIAEATNGKQYSVVVTLSDGRRFMLVKGNKHGVGSKTVIILGDHMEDDWVKKTTKDVSGVTLGEYVDAGGHNFNPYADNGQDAAERMMALG